MDPRPCVMVVDDSHRPGELFRDLFEGRYALDTRSSVHGALTGLLEQRPDVILVDVTTPETHAIEALRSIQAQEPTIPVIMVTRSTESEIAAEALRLGAFAYLPKPFKLPYAEHLVATARLQGRAARAVA